MTASPVAEPPSGHRPHVVVVGSGFGGLNAALRLASAPVDVTVIDRDNYHGFWPLLYQVATAGLGPDDIAHPIRAIYSSHPNISVRMGTVCDIDLDGRLVGLEDGDSLAYDFLIVAAGSSTSDFGIPGVAEHAWPLKTLPDAVELRNHVLTTFERADAHAGAHAGAHAHAGARAGAGRAPEGDLTILVIGGGPTGVELAGALSELVGKNLARDFHHLGVSRARVVLVEMTDRLLPGFSRQSQDRAKETLRSKGVEIRFATGVAEVTAGGAIFQDGSGIAAATVIWTAGVRANPIATVFSGAKGKGGTVAVLPDLSVPGRPEVFVIGDLAASTGTKGEQLPQLAQVAIQGGRHAAKAVRLRLAGQPVPPFHYRNHGIMATIGRRAAVAELPGGIKFSGTLGWLSWLVVHLVFLIGFRNRAVVLVNWAWNYLTWDRGSRVILETTASNRRSARSTAQARQSTIDRTSG